jgi:predicted nucleic acid-binding protein
VSQAEEEARTLGLSALDALHVAAAIATGSTELVTSEKPGKPIHRLRRVSVRSIYPSR